MRKNWNIILGSGSPRRKDLLKLAGLEFVQQSIDVEEVFPPDLSLEEVAEYLAKLKADGGMHLLKNEEDLLITADTVVIHKDQILGKPSDDEDAFNMLKQLSDQWHTVISGVVLKSLEKAVSFSNRSEVLFDHLSDDEILFYIEHFQPFDKAGAYGIQDWIGWTKIKRIEGLYSNIMGLPVQPLYAALAAF